MGRVSYDYFKQRRDYYSWIYESERYCILEEIYDLVESGQFSEQNS